ncbi:rho guanine nucleotide exchange factor TIAM2 isoform 1-T3 [Anableps anableps]
MGNTDSHSSFTSPVKPYGSLGFSTKKEEVASARSWWRSSQTSGRSQTGGYLGQQASWHYESAPRGGAKQSAGSPQRFHQGDWTQGGRRSPFGFQGTNGDQASLQCGSSPKVLLSKDGSMRVEFTNARVVPVEPQDPPPTSIIPESSQRTSKGSSLSSEGSWYDSPWGAASELPDNVFVCGRSVDTSSGYNTCSSTQVEDISPGFSSALLFPAAENAKGHNSCSSGRTEDSGIGDSVILQPDLQDLSLVSPADFHSRHHTLPAFPTSSDSFLQKQLPTSSSSSVLDNVIQEEAAASVGGLEARYFSHTLPNRKAEPVSAAYFGNNRKDFLKSRIRQLSDWTGSLSRKKRRIQEPHSSDTSGVFINRLNSGAPWSSNPLLQLNQNQFPPVHWDFSRSLNQNQSSDAQRQNVYRNFMQELETDCSSMADRTEPSEEDDDDGEEEMEEEAGGELDVLLEKDQGVVRRAGWLHFKALITVNKDRKLELVARRKWRRYWVTLKGCSLLFYATFGRSSGSTEQELSPRYALLADDSIVQAIPEHPRREHVFCLSNSHGDVYMFQATNQTDLENWVTAIHSASAALLARRQRKEDTLRLLRCQSCSLLHKIDMDGKMKKMAELQLSIIKDQKNRRAVESQIQQWEQNLEKLNLDLFRLRCYLSSLQGSELPNPKSLLAVASRPSKTTLGRLGVFSVSSFHALVCSREEGSLRRRCRSVSGGSSRRRGLPSSLKALPRPSQDGKHSDHQVLHRHVSAPSAQLVPAVCWSETVTCESKQREVLPSAGHVAELQLGEDCPSTAGVFSLHVCRPDSDHNFGFAVTGHVDGAGKSHVFVSEVDPLGLSATEGLLAGDEVLAVNGSAVSGLDLDHLHAVFRHQNLHLLLRRDELPELEEPAVVWPDPSDPAELWVKRSSPPDLRCWTAEAPPPGPLVTLTQELPEQNTEQVFSLYQTFPESKKSDVDIPKNPYSREGSLQPASPAHLSVCQRLRKVIQELVDTEKSYVKDLVCLFDIYLTPLQNETFLSKDEMEALFGSLPEMLDFQRVFLQTLEERIAACPDFSSLETPEQFKMLLFSLGGSFLYYADHFKLYSGFCANHIKVQKVLERAKTDGAFKHFLETRNPTNQHSSSLESYLIKPVQRVLKYPLLLRELVSLTDAESPEHTHLTEALRAMEKVASHINEMQKIYEDYGSVFDQLAAEQSGADKQVTEISMGEFLVHSSVVWLNPLPCLRRLRKEPQLTLFVFKRAVILVHRENKLKKRMTGSRSADLDPFRFRWFIPVSALQVRPANIPGSEEPCVWELVHSRSEVEGRPETVFQLCSSDLETKAALLRALSSLLKDRAPAGSLRRTKQSASWRRRPRHGRSDPQRPAPHPPEESCRPNGVLEETCSEPLLPSHAGSSGRRPRLCSLTGELEAQLQRLNFSEEAQGAPQHLDEEKRRSSSLRRGPGGDGLDFSSFMGRDFSVQSMTSIINEDCFYDSVLGIRTDNINPLT